MSLVVQNEVEGPGTHALLIGIGGYPDLARIGFTAPRKSMALLLDWLLRDFHNPQAPLASVEVLHSGPGLGLDNQPFAAGQVEPESLRPSVLNIRGAIEKWLARARSDPDNIGIVYCAGLGYASGGPTAPGPRTLLTDEASDVDFRRQGAISVDDLQEAFRRGGPRKLLTLFEGHRLSGRFLTSLGHSGLVSGQRIQPLFEKEDAEAAWWRAAAYVDVEAWSATEVAPGPGYDPQPLLVLALLEILNGPRPANQWLHAEDLRYLDNAVRALELKLMLKQRQYLKVGVERGDNFRLHFPKLEEEKASGVADASQHLEGPAPPPGPAPAAAAPAEASAEAAGKGLEDAALKTPLISEIAAANAAAGKAVKAVKARKPKAAAKGRATPKGAGTSGPDPIAAQRDEATAWANEEMRKLEAEVAANERDPLAAIGTGKLAVAAASGVPLKPGELIAAVAAGDFGGDAPSAATAPASRSESGTGTGKAQRKGVAAGLRAVLEATEAAEAAEAAALERSAAVPAPATAPAPDPAPTPAPAPDPPPPPDEANTDFILDDAEAEHDDLGRSVLAIGLARRLHKIWSRTNGGAASASAAAGGDGEDSRAAFVVHLDAPWGGGKTSFANFLARVLDPLPDGRRAAAFLAQRYPDADLGGIFLDDPPPDAAAASRLAALPGDQRRPWVVVNFNAWQAEHCAPPWWLFYQAIRKGCFDATWREGAGIWRPRAPLPADAGAARRFARRAAMTAGRALSRLGGMADCAGLWLHELAWRLFNPKILTLAVTAAFSLGLLWLLRETGLWGIIPSDRGDGAGYILGNPVGLVLTGLGGITGLWALGALFTESIVPGTDTLAERLSLGNGDPFARFRRHFANSMRRVRRPVLVVVDDLDRCRPDFVVDLVRGIQTLLRSPRVVFLILGDRDWIERAFEAHHQAMREIDVGPEQTFGARFVEKAIQMSFILPALGDESRLVYVRRVLLGDRAAPPARAPGKAGTKAGADSVARAAFGADAAAKVTDADIERVIGEAQVASQTHSLLREAVNRVAAVPGRDVFETGQIARQVHAELKGPLPAVAGGDRGPLAEEVHAEVERLYASGQLQQAVNETLAIRAVADEAVQREVVHELQRLAAWFPANPRQIKRIVNAITIYYAVALQRPGITPDSAFRTQLALWVIVMTEWPQTWRLLASFPDLVDILNSKSPDRDMRGAGLLLPGSPAATKQALQRIREDRALMALIGGGGEGGGVGAEAGHAPLRTASVRILAELTPLHSRRRRIAEAEAEADPAPAPPTRSGAEAGAGVGPAGRRGGRP